MYVRVFKRLFDFVIALIALLVLILPFFIISIIIRLESKGPIMFRQDRVGINGTSFKIYKFRSMYMEAPHNTATNALENPSDMITKVGKFLRMSSIDELPQLINVLKGDMSIIGPRPVIKEEKELVWMRHKNGAETILPGLTGLAQVHGRDHVNIQQAKYDGIYAGSISFTTDLKLVLRTIWYVLLHVGVHEGKREKALIVKKQESKYESGTDVVKIKRSKID